jgi:hypothetical protein
MWHKEHLWNLCVLQRGILSSRVYLFLLDNLDPHVPMNSFNKLYTW